MRLARVALCAFVAGCLLASCGRTVTGPCAHTSVRADTVRGPDSVLVIMLTCR